MFIKGGTSNVGCVTSFPDGISESCSHFAVLLCAADRAALLIVRLSQVSQSCRSCWSSRSRRLSASFSLARSQQSHDAVPAPCGHKGLMKHQNTDFKWDNPSTVAGKMFAPFCSSCNVLQQEHRPHLSVFINFGGRPAMKCRLETMPYRQANSKRWLSMAGYKGGLLELLHATFSRGRQQP
jgi:hypothetical protein